MEQSGLELVFEEQHADATDVLAFPLAVDELGTVSVFEAVTTAVGFADGGEERSHHVLPAWLGGAFENSRRSFDFRLAAGGAKTDRRGRENSL